MGRLITSLDSCLDVLIYCDINISVFNIILHISETIYGNSVELLLFSIILLLLYLWDGILSFLPSSALSGMIGILLILTLIVVYIYHMTKNWMLAAGIEAVGSAAALIVYFVKSSLYENLLTKLLGRLALADVFMNISSSNIVDVSGLLLYVSILIIFVFLTIQTIQKRRWS